jgi:hypothetical protein
LYTVSKQYQKQRDIDNVYSIVLQLDSLSQKVRDIFSEEDELYLYARHNLAEQVKECFTMTLDSNLYYWSVNVQNEVLSLAASLYGENSINYINEVEHLVNIKSSILNLYYLIHQE